jgi:3-oxoacyl-[acyl-carrier protein] reductase
VTLDLGLDGKRAIVCASSKGLGWACAAALACNGVRVTINGSNEERLAAAAKAILEATGASVDAVVADIATEDGRARLVGACPQPDILVNNNAGPPVRDFRELEPDDMMKGVEQNMIAPIEMIKLVIDGMRERKFGRIVNITSASVKMPIFGLDLSSGARAGLTAFLAGVARSVIQDNVTINFLLPGMFATDRLMNSHVVSAEMQGTDVETYRVAMLEKLPARRFGEPAEFGEACAFLCSAGAGYITGQNLLIDGGWHQSAF